MTTEKDIIKNTMNTNLEKQLDNQFPKGDKSRGKALVLFAIAQIEIDDAKIKLLKDVNKMIDEEYYLPERKLGMGTGKFWEKFKQSLQELGEKQ